MHLEGLGNINWDELFSIPKAYWQEDVKETRSFVEEQVKNKLDFFLPFEIRF